MRKGEGEILAVPANEWARYRADGFDFSTQAEYEAQQQGKPDAAPATEKKASKKKRTVKRS